MPETELHLTEIVNCLAMPSMLSEIVVMEERVKTRVNQLATGMRQKLDFARDLSRKNSREKSGKSFQKTMNLV